MPELRRDKRLRLRALERITLPRGSQNFMAELRRVDLLKPIEQLPTGPGQCAEGGTLRSESVPRMAGDRVRRCMHPLLLILLVGALLRLVLWTWFPNATIHIWDERDYNTLAKNLVQHGEFAFTPGTPTSLRPPLYPAAVAAVYWLFGLENFQAVRLLQAGLSLLMVLLLYRLGSEVLSRRGAVWLAGLYSFYPSMLGYNNLLLTEVLFTFLLCAACYSLVLFFKRGTIAYLLATGGLLGLAALTRSVVWLLPPLLGAFVFLTWKATLRRRILAPVALVVAFAATLVPWTIRNTKLQNTFITIDTMGGRNFMMGNYRFTPLYRSWDAISLQCEQYWFHEVSSTYPPCARNTQGRVDKLALRQGLNFVRENPGLTLKRDVVKLFDFWGLERELIAGAGQGYFGEMPRPALVLLTLIIFGSYTAAMILGVFGMVMTPPSDRRIHWSLLLVIAFICGMHTLVFAHSRYHLPVMPLVLVYSANALVNARHVWERRRQWSFWLANGLSGLFIAGWLWGILVVDLERYLDILRSAE